ncbi:hypothetical protein QT971_16480 [Microcoleus sp. herbarium19]|uniref:hypothetical protein n=1 Tax=Microcoleus sp. herbarium13 TaxID=3055438 RepID=UPI002FD58AF5
MNSKSVFGDILPRIAIGLAISSVHPRYPYRAAVLFPLTDIDRIASFEQIRKPVPQ